MSRNEIPPPLNSQPDQLNSMQNVLPETTSNAQISTDKARVTGGINPSEGPSSSDEPPNSVTEQTTPPLTSSALHQSEHSPQPENRSTATAVPATPTASDASPALSPSTLDNLTIPSDVNAAISVANGSEKNELETVSQKSSATAYNSTLDNQEATANRTNVEETKQLESTSAMQTSSTTKTTTVPAEPLASNPSGQSTSPLASATDAEGGQSSIYEVKWIEFGLRSSAIITQNENGPCPLISIVNVLLLRDKLALPEGCKVVSAEQLLGYLGDLVLRLSTDNTEPDLQRNINDAVTILPRLSTGLDVNVKFTGVSHFEYTNEQLIFDILDINLYHGWLVDPQMEDLCLAVNSLSYNQLVEKIITNNGSKDSELVSQSLIAQHFLEDSASQLTYHGLCELNSNIGEQNLGIFFRNNHFSTIFKRNGELFLLVTDQGFLAQKDVVWETLANIEGDSRFVNSSFQTTGVDQNCDGTSSMACDEQQENDRILAVKLQREATEAVEREQSFHQFKTNQIGNTDGMSDGELAARLQEVENLAAEEAQLQLQQQQQQSMSQQAGRRPENRIGPRNRNCTVL